MNAAVMEPTGFLWAILFALGGGAGLPLGVPPEPQPPVMTRVAPEECLFFTTWSGVAAPDAQSANPTEQLLAEPEVRHLLSEIERLVRAAVADKARAAFPAEQAADAEKAVDLVKLLLTRPVTLFVSSAKMTPAGPDVRGGAVVYVGDRVLEVKAFLEKYQKQFLGEAFTSVQLAGGEWHQVKVVPDGPAINWGTRGQCLVVAVGDGELVGILQRARGKPPKWLTTLQEQLPVDRPATLSYVNLGALREMLLPLVPDPRVRPLIDAAGLGNVVSMGSVTGLDRGGFVGKSLLALDGPPTGLLAPAAAKPLEANDLAPIPRDATIAAAARADLDSIVGTILEAASKTDPGAKAAIEMGLGIARAGLGFELRDDLLQSLGDVWCLYHSPGEGGLVFTGLTAVVQVKDHQKLAKVQEQLLAKAKQLIDAMPVDRDLETGRPTSGMGREIPPRIEQFACAGQTIYTFHAGQAEFPLAPAWCLTDKELIVSLFSQNIKAYLSRGADYESLAKVAEVGEALEGDARPFKLLYVDTRAIVELLYPLAQMGIRPLVSELQRQGIDVDVSLWPSAPAILRHLRPSTILVRRTEAGIEVVNRQTVPGASVGAAIPITVAVALPAVQAARAAAMRSQSMNNLKQIGLAMHNHHDVYKAFPGAYIADKEGKPLLSWRVKILPFVEASPLYDQFRLDEPWDSEHNKKLIARMPSVYRSPQSKAGPGMTTYLTVRGKDTMFPGAKAIGIRDITDGTSNTIMAVEATDEAAVIWTKPDDFQPNANNPFKGLVGPRSEGFLALLGDGSVRFIGRSIDPEVLRRLFERNDGEAVPEF